MYIEINSMAIAGYGNTTAYLDNMEKFISRTEDVIDAFADVAKSTTGLAGGLGSLWGAYDEIESRIGVEEEKVNAAKTVLKKSNDFIDLANRVDRSVAEMVHQNKEAFYSVNPWLRPPEPEEKGPLERLWDGFCEGLETIGEALKDAFELIKDTAVKAWNGIKEFYNEHKKIIDTILAVAGAVLAIVAVVASGGLALAPLLCALGCSAGVAAAISGAVAVVAVVSTVAATSLNVTDIWCEIDNPTFQKWKKGLNIVSGISNGIYSIGNLYNSFKGITNQDLKQWAKLTKEGYRPGFGSYGQQVDYLSDFYPGSDDGIIHNAGTKEFYSVTNQNGGRIYVSTDPISQYDFANIVDGSNGTVNILTGTHGSLDGGLCRELKFFYEDAARWGGNPNVRLFDVTQLSPNMLSGLLNSNATNVCAWCYSERSIAILQALSLIP